MENGSYQFYGDKLVIRIRNRVCDTVDELISSEIFMDLLSKYVRRLFRQQSRLLRVFTNEEQVTTEELKTMQKTLVMLSKLPADQAKLLVPGCETFFEDIELLSDFVEQLYNFWRGLHRLIICDSIGDRLDKRPYRTFNDTVERLMHVVRSAQRDILENITGDHPRVYRQVSAGAEMAAIALPEKIPYPTSLYEELNKILVARQVLIYPPMIYNSATNKRSGTFTRVNYNPLEGLEINPKEWLCYPAKVGSLVINVYFSMTFFEMGFSLSNLFELAEDEDLKRKPDAIFLFGIPSTAESAVQEQDTIFYDDEENDLLVGSVPFRKEYSYFGYLKKMILTLHNIKMMKLGRMPFHGAMFHIVLRNAGSSNVILIGDSGAGKSETLEALRGIIEDQVEELTIVADDMGSIELTPEGNVIGYGTEIGAFVRLDDLQKGYALGQIDRTIIMNPDQVNARVVIPVTKYKNVIRGFDVDFILYANNYDSVDEDHPVIEQFNHSEMALDVFRSGAVMSKGTTTTTGLTHSYFANIFGPPQYRNLHEEIAQKYFNQFFQRGIFVGEMRTQLGISGKEYSGPEESARALLNMLLKKE
ncbi:MAG: phosphoenolpyruvate carboxykinase [Chloroflexi bacterium HGW-Chloroflexi-8]|nr:MAG: phosphoenolpyruvate carboxykinase [Chloroflexi bacterium HGW-Chloroflexi-8]